MYDRSGWVVTAIVVVCVTVIAIAATQTLRFNCVDLGFYKSCGVSTIR